MRTLPMYTITKADKHRFIVQKSFDYSFWVLARIMLAALPLSLIYYIVDCLTRKG